ncbi:LppU/SCO3897 family protein [Streptomyces sp. NPDC055239]
MPEPIYPTSPNPPTPPTRPTPRPGASARGRGCLVTLGAVGAVIIGILLLNQGDDDSDSAAPAPSTSQGSYTPYTDAPNTNDPYTSAPPAEDTADTDDPYATGTAPVDTPTSEAPTPFSSGTCLNGTLPDSTTAQEVDDVDEVSCSAADAHYEVIETIPMTSDMSRCDGNPKTQYAFSYRYTLNGSAINEYVYCLVGLGSYAR